MKLKDYLIKNQIDVEYFSTICQVSFPSLYAYMNGKRRPKQSTAEKIEKATKGKVTVLELRGVDERGL